MRQGHGVLTGEDDPLEILGLAPGAGDEEIRAAYLRGVRAHPPDRDPQQFERIRDAYAMLQDPRQRALRRLLAVDPRLPLPALLEGRPEPRRFVGPGPWIAALRKP
jgi:curved DNA-binding protein CbpA